MGNQKAISQLLTVFALILITLLTVTLMASIYGVVLDESRHPLGFVFVSTLISLGSWMIYEFRKIPLLKKADFIHALCVGGLALVIFIAGHYIQDVYRYNITNDETSQSAASETPLGIVYWASQEQQAPSDYYLTFSSIKIIGKSVWGVRSKNLLATFVLLALLLSFTHYISRSWILSVSLTMIFASNSQLHQHMWHARPLALALVHQTLMLILLSTLFSAPAAMKPRKWPLSLFVTTFFLLLASCGLQPTIALFGAVIAGLFCLTSDGAVKFKLIKAFTMASILFLPYLILTIILSHEANQFYDSSEVFLKNLKHIGMWSTWKTFFIVPFPLAFFAWLVAGSLFIFRMKSLLSSTLFRFSALNLLIFPLTFVVIFKLVVDYNMASRYHILHLINALFFLIICVGPISFKKKKERYISCTVIGITFLWLICSVYSNEGWKTWRFTPAFQQDYSLRSAYTSIQKYTKPQDYIYTLFFENPGHPIIRRFTAPHLYAVNHTPTSPHFRPPTLQSIQMTFPELWNGDNFLVQDAMAGVKAERMVFIHYQPNPDESTDGYLPFQPPPGVTHHRIPNVDIFIVSVEKDMASSALPFYLALVDSANGNPNIAPQLETALFLAILSKNEAAFEKLYRIYESFLQMDFRDEAKYGNYIRYHDCRFLARVFRERARDLGWKVLEKK